MKTNEEIRKKELCERCGRNPKLKSPIRYKMHNFRYCSECRSEIAKINRTKNKEEAFKLGKINTIQKTRKEVLEELLEYLPEEVFTKIKIELSKLNSDNAPLRTTDKERA